MKLVDIFHKLDGFTDKYDLGYIDTFYDELFAPYRESATNVLEIGIHKGGSLELWEKYFTQATITGIDPNPLDNLPPNERIVKLVRDAYTQETISLFGENSFDIIIDDGPHDNQTQEYFLKEYFKLLKPGGLLVLEDIVNIDNMDNLLKLIDTDRAEYNIYEMAGLQKTEELLSAWSQGLNVIVVRKVS